MPDHLHALVAFPNDTAMGKLLGSWKSFHAKQHCIRWQSIFFDHRIRNRDEFDEKAAYILRNPVVKGLCATGESWRWFYCGNS